MARIGNKVTLKDIAAETGYSANAVSRALRGMRDIGPEATNTIREAAQRLGYVGNHNARALRSGQTNTIALLVPSVTNPYFSVMTDLIQIEAEKEGYSLIVMCTRDTPSMAMQCAEQAMAHCVDGVLFFPTLGCEQTLQRLKEAGMPFVEMSCSIMPQISDCIIIDDEAGGRLGAAHLLDAGKKKLCFLSASDSTVSVKPRGDGFMHGCRDAGLAPENYMWCNFHDWYFHFDDEQAWRTRMTDELLTLHREGFDGLFIFCDQEAFRVQNLLEHSEVLSPDMFGVVGFDDLDGYQTLMQPMCSIDGGQREIAKLGVARLITRIRGSDEPALLHRCSVHVTCRGSCRHCADE